MARREALVHVSAKAGTQAIYAFREADHTLRNAAYVMPKVLPHHVEMAPGFGGGVSHFLAECPELSAHRPELPVQGPELLAHGPEVLAQGSEVLAEGPEFATYIIAKSAQDLVEVSAGLGVHGATLPVRPHPFQVCRVGYSGDHRGLDRPVESAAAAVEDGLEVGEDPLVLLDYQRLAGSGSPSKSDVGSGSGGVTSNSAATA